MQTSKFTPDGKKIVIPPLRARENAMMSKLRAGLKERVEVKALTVRAEPVADDEAAFLYIAAHCFAAGSAAERIANEKRRENERKLVAWKSTLATIVSVVADFYGVSTTDIYSARRAKQIVFPRQVAMYMAFKLTGNSYPVISRHIGNRDHTTGIYSVRKIEKMRSERSDVQSDLERLQLRVLHALPALWERVGNVHA